jgi:hypothetical protein
MKRLDHYYRETVGAMQSFDNDLDLDYEEWLKDKDDTPTQQAS